MNKKLSAGRIRRLIINSIVHIGLAIVGFIWILPLFFVVLTSFREESGTYKSYIFPKGYTWDNYANLFSNKGTLDFPQWFINTLLVAIASCILSAFLCYAFPM